MAHIHYKNDFTVEVFVVHQDKVLLRLHDKYKIWLSVGGHIDLDEDPNKAAIREVKEEVGLDIKLYDTREFTLKNDHFEELIPPIFLNTHAINDVHNHIGFTYFATAKTFDVIPEKKDDLWKWLSKDEVSDMSELEPQIKYYALKALETLGQ